jgi:hypothetical protein
MDNRSFPLIANRTRRTLPQASVTTNGHHHHGAAASELNKPRIHLGTLDGEQACSKVDPAPCFV